MEGLLAWQHAVQFNVSCGLLVWIECLHSPAAGNIDYRVSSNMVTIPAHENNVSVTLVEVLPDTACDGTETLKADLSITQPPVNVTILPATSYITILDTTGKAAAKYCVYSYVIYLHTLVQSMYVSMCRYVVCRNGMINSHCLLTLI